MKKIEKTSWQALVLQMLAFAVAAIIIWPLFDLIWAALVTHSEFKYSVGEHILGPIVFGIICGLIFWLIDRANAKKKK